MPKQPDDEFSDLPISRQAKWQRRNPDKTKAMRKRWLATESGKHSVREANRRYLAKRKIILDNDNYVE